MHAPEILLHAEGLVRCFGERRALDGLDLSLARGQCLGLLGPNGAGKTTAIRVLCGALAAHGGTVALLGLDPQADGIALRARIGVVPQELALYEGLSARENLRFFGRIHGVAGAELERRVARALAWAGLSERADERVAAYSGGMKRRLNIVAATVHEPELLFLDEPTVGVDPQSRQRIFEMVGELRARGATLVYTSHQLGEVERLCDRIAILDHGRAIAAGTLAELRARVPQRAGAARSLRVASADRLGEARALLAGAGIACELDEGGAGLEDVFLALTGRELRDEP